MPTPLIFLKTSGAGDSLSKVINSQNSVSHVNLPQMQSGSAFPRNIPNHLPQVAGSMSTPNSPMYNGATSSAPIISRQ